MKMTTDMRGCVATIGFFDGVHRGHLYVINQLVANAKACGLRSLIFSFRQHPRVILQKEYVPQLLTLEAKRKQLLSATGVDGVVLLDFTPSFARQTAADFMTFLYREYDVRRLLVGYNQHFGYGRRASFADYKCIGERIGMDVVQSEPLVDKGINISSSVIRSLLSEGNIHLANAYLGYGYGFEGIIIRGRGEGRKIGFPTANMMIDRCQVLPRCGVYGVKVAIEGMNEQFVGMMNIGCRPTFGDFDEQVEVNIFCFDADIYDRQLTIEIFLRLREEHKFASIDDLKSQLQRDKNDILAILRTI